MPDPVLAVAEFLASDSDVEALVGARVFGGELPETEESAMPRACLVVREAGGGAIGAAWQQYGDVRFDVFAYGASPWEATELRRAVHVRMKSFARVVSNGVLLHWAKLDGGPFPIRDPDTTWPLVFTSWQVLISEVEAT